MTLHLRRPGITRAHHSAWLRRRSHLIYTGEAAGHGQAPRLLLLSCRGIGGHRDDCVAAKAAEVAGRTSLGVAV